MKVQQEAELKKQMSQTRKRRRRRRIFDPIEPMKSIHDLMPPLPPPLPHDYFEKQR